uniref:Uncharacterized protein n=1 Tax=Ciona savignyi TaxID=51511 RepID=H2Z4I1_CIOSA
MEKADNFSQRLANRLSEYDLQDDDVELYFNSAISSLATKQKDLHDYLLEHFDTQLSVFKRHLTLTQPTFETSPPNQSKLDGKSLTSELLTHHSDKQMLVNILQARSQERQGNNSADLSKLILGINANELHHVATSIFKYYDGI